ncbi:MBL fold metallo-hydrolase [Streptomyces sp. NPDC045369]|uniref:MBL fold metallo-hydrolase n=1 Tax=Streptomyces sp. NPDC045369 TaxID=3155732 RepID=UPI0033C67FFF
MSTPRLVPLSPTTWAWTHDSTAWGFSNCGLVASDGEALLMDTQFTLRATRELLDAIAGAVPDATVTTVVNSHQNGDHTWGNELVADAEIITSEASAAHLCQEMTPDMLAALSRSEPTTAVTAYAVEHFGVFDFGGITVTPPTRTFTGSLDLTVGRTAVRLLDLGPGHSAGDVALHVPEDGVVFTGDALFDGGHMIVWSGSLTSCVTACDTLLATGATTFVPGHGRITDRAGVTAFRDRLSRIMDTATAHARKGTELAEAARLVQQEYAGGLAHPERLFTAVAAAYREAGAENVPSTTFELVEGMAQLAAG